MTRNPDLDPRLWLVLAIVVPCIVALELLIAFDTLRGAAWTRVRKST